MSCTFPLTMCNPRSHDEFARPGNSDFTGFPKHQHEDTVTYSIHIISSKPLSIPEHRSKLHTILQASKTLSKGLFKDYIWQRDPFTLTVSESNTPYLEGLTCFGDSIADEWAIVYLLREISKQFEDTWIRIVDDDGQFLLIEAANVLPNWLDPEVAGHRLWINAGQLKIIPRSIDDPQSSATKTEAVDLEAALSFLKSQRDALIVSKEVEAEAFHRLRNYPSQIAESMHTTKITLPRKLAYVLKRIPAAISPAASAFFSSDYASNRRNPDSPLVAPKPFFPPEDFVTTSVKFTRIGYAQLKGQDVPDLEAWKDAYTAPPRPHSKTTERYETGMKVTQGFELLLADARQQYSRVVREMRLIFEDIDTGDDKLPTDEELATWPDIEEDEAWLDVDFEAMERELSGHRGNATDAAENEAFGAGGFGDLNAQGNLRMIVDRMQSFMQNENADLDAGEDDSDASSDDEEEEDDDDALGSDDDTDVSGEDKAGSFTDAEFENAMKQMMGLAPTTSESTNRMQELDDTQESSFTGIAEGKHADFYNETDEAEDEDDTGKDTEEDGIALIQRLMASMESELAESGAMDPSTLEGRPQTDDERYQLAKEMLHSLQGGVDLDGSNEGPETLMESRTLRKEHG